MVTFKELYEGKLDPATEAALEAALQQVGQTRDMNTAKAIAQEFLSTMKHQEKAQMFMRQVNNARRVDDIVATLYNIKLAGEGLGVIGNSRRR